MKTLTAATVALLLVTAACAQDAPSPWFSEARWSALKTVDTLTSIGAGVSVNVYRFAPERSAWLDGCPIYDGVPGAVGGFGGLSTEIKGLPLLGFLLAPIAGVADCVGLGCKITKGETTVTAYVSTHF